MKYVEGYTLSSPHRSGEWSLELAFLVAKASKDKGGLWLCVTPYIHRVPKKGSHQTFGNNFLKS